MTGTLTAPRDVPIEPSPVASAPPLRSRLRPLDALRAAVVGLRARRLRSALTALGIAIGIAAMVAVVGISASSRADVLAEIDALGTGLLRAAPGRTVFGDEATLPDTSRATAARIGPVLGASGLTYVDATVRRNELISSSVTGGIAVAATDPSVLATTNTALATGRFLDAVPTEAPVVVLGADAAARLGIGSLDGSPKVWITAGDGSGQWFDVVGILEPSPLAPELDSAALVGYGVAGALWDTSTSPSTLFVSVPPDQVEAVRAVLAATVDPQSPNEVQVSRPSDALEARAKTDVALRNLLLALGGVALLVGGVGITNVMVIAVLERRAEIGVRRALGAQRRHIAAQFVLESAMLSMLGGVLGALLGGAVTATYAATRGWPVSVSAGVLAAGAALALGVGLLAGVSPAIRAARLDPAEAIRPS